MHYSPGVHMQLLINEFTDESFWLCLYLTT